jgi:hypothetical protein
VRIETMNRRRFFYNSANLAAGAAVGAMAPKVFTAQNSHAPTAGNISVQIPMPIQVVIDDVGWWSGEDGNLHQEPYRTGIMRNHVPADYSAIAELGSILGIRPQAAMVLCEWDKFNILRRLPTSTWMGDKWDNSKWVGPWMEEAADIIKKNGKNFEMTLHGLGHEYWVDGTFTRAEWATKDGTMRPRDQVEKHLDFFNDIFNQHKLGAFPVSFVPTAFCHAVAITRGNDISMADILKKRGIYYINTPFNIMANSEVLSNKFFGFDDGVMTIDRGADLLDWNIIGVPPSGPLQGPVCGMHWPNLLHPDPSRNSEIVQEWVKLLRPYNDRLETMLAKDSEQFQVQLAHYGCTELNLVENSIGIDFSKTDLLPAAFPRDEFFIKIKSTLSLKFASDDVRITTENSPAKNSSDYLLKLKRDSTAKKSILKYIVT